MSQPLSPDKAMMRRHSAAMKIIDQVDRHERVLLLGYVTGLIDAPLLDATEAEIDAVEEEERVLVSV